MAKIIDETCRKCWGSGSVIGPLGDPSIMRQVCNRCRGTGDEPKNLSRNVAIIGLYTIFIIALIIGLSAIWSSK